MPYLNKCLDSAVNQSFKDYEIIIVNDSSPDGSQKIINLYKKAFPNKVKSFTKQNNGVSDARNFGIEKSQGEYICFLDSDDTLPFDAIENLYNTVISSGSDVAIGNYEMVSYDSDDNISTKVYRDTVKHFDVPESIYNVPKYLRYSSPYVWNKIIKRELFNDPEMRFQDHWYEDSELIYKLLGKAEKIAPVKKVVYYYRVKRNGSITSTFDERIFDIFKSIDSFTGFYKRNGNFDLLYTELEYLAIMHIQARLIALSEVGGKVDLKLRFTEKAFAYLDENFSGWRNNKYYKWVNESHKSNGRFVGFQEIKDDIEKVKNYYLTETVNETHEEPETKSLLYSLYKKCQKKKIENSYIEETEITIKNIKGL